MSVRQCARAVRARNAVVNGGGGGGFVDGAVLLPAVRNAHDAIIVTTIQYEKTAVASGRKSAVSYTRVRPSAPFQHVVRVRVRVDNVPRTVHTVRAVT